MACVLGKSKVYLRTCSEGPEVEEEYSSALSLTSVVGVGGWLTPRPGRSTLGKETRYSLYGRLGGPEGQSGRVREISGFFYFLVLSLYVIRTCFFVWIFLAF